MVFKKCSELESHLDIGEHCHIRWNFDTAYDRLKRDWVEKFLSVDKEDIDRAHLESTGEQQHEHGASSSSSDLQLDWELHKPRSEAVRFTCEVKLYLSTKSDLAERTGMKADPGKVAAYMRMIRNPDSSRMFERKDWLTSLKIGGCKKETGKPRSWDVVKYW